MYLAAKVKILFNKTKVLSPFVYCVQGDYEQAAI